MPLPTLGAVCEAVVDCEHRTAPLDPDGDFFAVGTPAMRGNRIDYSEARRIDSDTFATWTRRLRPIYGDLLLAREAPVGPVVMIPLEEHVAPGQRTVLIRPDHERVDARYLYYLLSSPAEQYKLQGLAEGSTVPHLNVADIRSLTLPTLPTLSAQRAIGELLGALDDKIEANRKLAAATDELSRWRFKKLQARPGAQSVSLSSTARFVNGRAFTKDASGTGRVVVRIAELNSGLSGSTVRNDIEVADEHVARPGDLLFAWSGSLTLARWFRDEAIVNQHIFKVIPNEGYPLWLVRQLVQDKLVEFQGIAADKATTMGHIQRRHLDEPVLVPPMSVICRADEGMGALWRRALLAEMESENLVRLRDTLLPKLMSGQLHVAEAAELVGS